jgi:hypothetical protein
MLNNYNTYYYIYNLLKAPDECHSQAIIYYYTKPQIIMIDYKK